MNIGRTILKPPIAIKLAQFGGCGRLRRLLIHAYDTVEFHGTGWIESASARGISRASKRSLSPADAGRVRNLTRQRVQREPHTLPVATLTAPADRPAPPENMADVRRAGLLASEVPRALVLNGYRVNDVSSSDCRACRLRARALPSSAPASHRTPAPATCSSAPRDTLCSVLARRPPRRSTAVIGRPTARRPR